MKKNLPTLKIEKDLWNKGFIVVGIDEVGRGCFAGPLVVGGVILHPDLNKLQLEKLQNLGINDSKKLSSNKRELLNKSIQEFTFYLDLQYISVGIINEIGIGKATTLGFEKIAKKVFEKIGNKNIFFITDAFSIPSVEKSKQLNIIRGDSASISIAAASIIAKVHRDNYMVKLSEEYPEYGFEKHKGYGTLLHRNAIIKHGLSSLHRPEFCKKYPRV